MPRMFDIDKNFYINMVMPAYAFFKGFGVGRVGVIGFLNTDTMNTQIKISDRSVLK